MSRIVPNVPMASPDTRPRTHVQKRSWIMLIIAVVVTLLSYQLEHHGLWGKLINYSKTPKLTLSGTRVAARDLQLSVYRPNGPTSYGSFVVQVTLATPGRTAPLVTWGPHQLAKIPAMAIHNRYHFQKITQGPWGLVVPLAAQGRILLPLNAQTRSVLRHSKQATVTVEDVSGLQWHITLPSSQIH